MSFITTMFIFFYFMFSFRKIHLVNFSVQFQFTKPSNIRQDLEIMYVKFDSL